MGTDKKIDRKYTKRIAARLLQRYRRRIAETIVDEGARIAPEIAHRLDRTASVRTMMRLTERTEWALAQGHDSDLRRAVAELADLRMAGGVDPAAYLSGSYVILPVLRRTVLAKAPNAEIGLAVYEEIERVLLPVLAHLCVSVMRAFQQHTDDEVEFTNPGLFPSLVRATSLDDLPLFDD